MSDFQIGFFVGCVVGFCMLAINLLVRHWLERSA
jgi:hypothetical protein